MKHSNSKLSRHCKWPTNSQSHYNCPVSFRSEYNTVYFMLFFQILPPQSQFLIPGVLELSCSTPVLRLVSVSFQKLSPQYLFSTPFLQLISNWPFFCICLHHSSSLYSTSHSLSAVAFTQITGTDFKLFERLVTERSLVQVPAGVSGEHSSPGSAFCADSYFSIPSTPVLL